MKTTLMLLSLTAFTMLACVKPNPVAGSWSFDNISNVDSSENRETLLGTFIPTNWSEIKSVKLSADNAIVLLSTEEKELATGTYELSDNRQLLKLKFPNDPIESQYKIMELTDSTLIMTAYDDGETVNINLSR